jgi:hypothetical protein
MTMDDGAALVAHQLRRREAHRRERLQIGVLPLAPGARTQELAALERVEEGKVLAAGNLHVEAVGIGGGSLQRVPADDRTDHLLGVGMDEYGILHGRASPWEWPRKSSAARAGCPAGEMSPSGGANRAFR